MPDLTYCRLAAVSIGILSLNQIEIDPATAAPRVALIDRSTLQSSRLNIGLQPIMQDADRSSGNRNAIDRSAANTRQPLGVGVSARVGTLGIGVDVAKSITPQFNGRLGFNFGNVNFNRTDSGINYDSQLKLSSVQLFGDYYPFRSSGFRLTGGLVAQNNQFSVTSQPNNNGTYTIDGTQYQASNVGTLSGEYKYSNSIAPYLGIGIGKSTNEGLGFNADLGVMFTGSPQVTLNASNSAFNTNPITRNQLDNQVRQTENDLRGFNVYPVLSVGLSYGF
ncbi:hypothetical protein [Chamaesiphon sp.]|uniref:hypothetical protein n=1 Tax=Chamaesiphon sp. TaxID=2814140 RepID=UPI0035941FF3